MKKIIIIITIFALLLNIAAGSLLSIYPWFNVNLNNIIILANGILLLIMAFMPIKDGWKVSVSSLFSFAAFVEFIFGLFSPGYIKDNPLVLGLLITIVLEIILISIATIVSRETKNS